MLGRPSLDLLLCSTVRKAMHSWRMGPSSIWVWETGVQSIQKEVLVVLCCITVLPVFGCFILTCSEAVSHTYQWLHSTLAHVLKGTVHDDMYIIIWTCWVQSAAVLNHHVALAAENIYVQLLFDPSETYGCVWLVYIVLGQSVWSCDLRDAMRV